MQDCKVVTAQETACAKCFLKIHWEDDDFPEKIRAEKRSLSTGKDAEQTKDLDLEKLAVDLEMGGLVYGMLDAAPDSFPINIDSIFLNQISSERIASLCWTKYDEDTGIVSVSGCESNPNLVARYSRTSPYVLCLLTPRVQVQIVMNVAVHAPMSLKRYPYDRHIVPFCLATRVTIDEQGQETKWTLSKKCPDWAPNKYHEDGTILSESQTTPDLEYNHKRCFAYLPKKKGQKPILCVLIERQPLNFMVTSASTTHHRTVQRSHTMCSARFLGAASTWVGSRQQSRQRCATLGTCNRSRRQRQRRLGRDWRK